MSFRRGWIAVFLFTLAMINYMDRVALSMAATPLAKEFHLSSIAMGYLFSSFIWSYALLLLPMGIMIDRFGAKRMAAWGVFVWSLATALTGLSTSIVTLFASRLIMGSGRIDEQPDRGQGDTSVDPGERARHHDIALHRRLVFRASLLLDHARLIDRSVWMAGLVHRRQRHRFRMACGMARVFDLPEKVRWLKADERAKILDEQGPRTVVAGETEMAGFRSLLRTRTLWGLAIAQGCNAYTQYLLLTWLPSYLQATRHMSILKTGAFSAVPYGTAVVGCILIGTLSDRYLKKSGVNSGRRRNAVALALIARMAIFAVPFTSSISALLLIFCVTLTGNASTSALNYALLNDLLPNPGDVGKPRHS